MAARTIDGPEKAWLAMADLVHRLEVSESTIERWIREGTFYHPIKFSKNIALWSWRMVVTWEMSREFEAYLYPTKGSAPPTPEE